MTTVMKFVENMTSHWKFDTVSRCAVVTSRTFLPNFVLIRFETTEPWAFLKGRPNKKNKSKMSSDMRSVADVKAESVRE